jgi:SAM-dependent methyltransferase
MTDERLATKEHWDERWAGAGVTSVRFDPETPMYRDLHRVLQAKLPRDESFRFLEIGAYPGYLMWYFNRYFGYRPSGLEYVGWCCAHAQALLAAEGVAAELIEADLFTYDATDESGKWDVVASSGFIEHFPDPAVPLDRHVRLLKRGGYLVIVVPNHEHVYGAIMKRLSPEKYVTHNLMTLDDTVDALRRAGGCRVVHSGYIGRLGFWNCCVYEVAKRRAGRAYPLVRGPLWLLEHLAQWIVPNTRALSPSFLVVARKE